jgi:hypothetical protein
VFAAIGAASMLGGFMRLTIATTVTLVELTGDLSLVLPGMLSISIARAVAGYLHKDSYDESTIASRGMAFLQDTWLAQLEHCRVSLVEKQHEMLGTLADVEGIKFAADIMMKVPVIFTASSRAHISQLVSYTERRGAFVEETKANQRSLQVRCHRAHEIRAHLRSAPPARALAQKSGVYSCFASRAHLPYALPPPRLSIHGASYRARIALTEACVGENRTDGCHGHRQGR